MEKERTFKLNEFFSEEELNKIIKLKRAKEICEQVVKPKIKYINKLTKQKNDPMYVAYFLEHCVTQGKFLITNIPEE